MKIAIGSDHAGFDLRHVLQDYLREKGYEVIDYGCPEKVSVDYPVYGRAVAEAVKRGECDMGVLVCGTGFALWTTTHMAPTMFAVRIAWSEAREVSSSMSSESFRSTSLIRSFATTAPTERSDSPPASCVPSSVFMMSASFILCVLS